MKNTIYLQQVTKNYLTMSGLKESVVSVRSFDDSIIQRFDFIDIHHDFNTNSAHCILKLEDLAEFAIAVTCMGDRVAMNYDDDILKQYAYLFPTATDGKPFEQLLDAQALCNVAWSEMIEGYQKYAAKDDILAPLDPTFDDHLNEFICCKTPNPRLPFSVALINKKDLIETDSDKLTQNMINKILADQKLVDAMNLLKTHNLTNKLIYALSKNV